jgi:hypothetical protein
MFRQKFGREPEVNDPLFFDPDADTPKPVDVEAYKEAMIKMMGDAGLPGDLIYAFQKTGRLVSSPMPSCRNGMMPSLSTTSEKGSSGFDYCARRLWRFRAPRQEAQPYLLIVLSHKWS